MGPSALYSISSLTGVVDFTNSEPYEAFRRPWRVFPTSILVVGFVMFLDGQLDASRRFLFHQLDRSRFWLLVSGGCPRLIPITHRLCILCWLYRRPLDEQQTEKEEEPQACTIKEDYHRAHLISALNQELGLGRDG